VVVVVVGVVYLVVSSGGSGIKVNFVVGVPVVDVVV
jgi:hypothetical protein